MAEKTNILGDRKMKKPYLRELNLKNDLSLTIVNLTKGELKLDKDFWESKDGKVRYFKLEEYDEN